MADFYGLDPKTVGETIAAVIVALGTGWAARRSGERQASRSDATPATSAVVAASVISDASIAALGKSIREFAEQHHDDTRHLRDDLSDVRDAMVRLRTTIEAGLPPAAGVELAGLMARLAQIEGSRP